MNADEEAVALRSSEIMWAEDSASRGLGMRLEHVGPGFAILSMAVTEAMVNGHGICHGGFIFTLADSAFAFACNSYNQRAVAQSCHITYLAPARLGMRLHAEARERHRAERNGIYDVTVRNTEGAVIAEFRGLSRTVSGTIFSVSGQQ